MYSQGIALAGQHPDAEDGAKAVYNAESLLPASDLERYTPSEHLT
jgi:hypothetical protein